MKTNSRLEVIAYTMLAQLPMKFSFADRVFGLVGDGESLAEALTVVYMAQTKEEVTQAELDELDAVISEVAEGESQLPLVVDREEYQEAYNLLLAFMVNRGGHPTPSHLKTKVTRPRDESEDIIYRFVNGLDLPDVNDFLRSQSEPFDFGD